MYFLMVVCDVSGNIGTCGWSLTTESWIITRNSMPWKLKAFLSQVGKGGGKEKQRVLFIVCSVCMCSICVYWVCVYCVCCVRVCVWCVF